MTLLKNDSTFRPLGPLPIRRGLGDFFIMAGVLHLAEMIFATLYCLGQIPIIVSASLWSKLYFAHFLFLVVGGIAYLAWRFKIAGLFYAENLVDFLLGVGIFVILLSLSGTLLVRRLINPWFSLAPGTFLFLYGAGLWQGRRFGVLSLGNRAPR